jgi:hypothetical protein
MAGRGVDTLRFGPMKPVGLTDPRTGREPYACVQLRQDTLAGDHFSLVGFQTQMKWGEQARVLRLIPGLENAEFVRFGMIHRNTYINGPDVLRETWQVKTRDDLFFAGQISGVEGYVESAASGLMAGRNAAARALNQTIEARVELIEPWYDLWPQFVKKAQHAYEEEGYRFLVVSDISSYFENIDLMVLRDLLLRHLPGQVQLVNFLFMLLSHWTWPTVHGTPSARGIPQGFGVSSFLGNMYLLPLDQAFLPAMRKGTVRYLRYMDDIKVLTKDFRTARDALFRMNDVLRSLRLNIQGAKTRILEGEEVREELYDPRFAEVDAVVKEIGTKHTLTAKERADYAGKLRKHLRRVRGRRRLVKDRELRLFRRLITGFSLLRRPGSRPASAEPRRGATLRSSPGP